MIELKKRGWIEFLEYPKKHQRKCVQLLSSLKNFSKKLIASPDKFGKLTKITLRSTMRSVASNLKWNQLSHKHLSR